MRGRKQVAATRLGFARQCVLELLEERAAADPGQQMDGLASSLAAAVPELRSKGVAFSVASWMGRDGDHRELARWCFEWFAKAESLTRFQKPAPGDAAKGLERLKWLLEREPAELRFLERETEALVEQLKILAKGYALELSGRAAGAGQ